MMRRVVLLGAFAGAGLAFADNAYWYGGSGRFSDLLFDILYRKRLTAARPAVNVCDISGFLSHSQPVILCLHFGVG